MAEIGAGALGLLNHIRDVVGPNILLHRAKIAGIVTKKKAHLFAFAA